MSVLLHGMVARADERDQPVGHGVAFGKSVGVTIEFRAAEVVGLIRSLRRDEAGNIWAEAEVSERAPLASHPYFAVGITSPVLSKSDEHPTGVMTGGLISRVALVAQNQDPGLPPYEVVP